MFQWHCILSNLLSINSQPILSRTSSLETTVPSIIWVLQQHAKSNVAMLTCWEVTELHGIDSGFTKKSSEKQLLYISTSTGFHVTGTQIRNNVSVFEWHIRIVDSGIVWHFWKNILSLSCKRRLIPLSCLCANMMLQLTASYEWLEVRKQSPYKYI